MQAFAPRQAHRLAAATSAAVPGRRRRARCSGVRSSQRARMAVVDERPPVWVGHVALYVSDVDRSTGFWGSDRACAPVAPRRRHRDLRAPRRHPPDPASGRMPPSPATHRSTSWSTISTPRTRSGARRACSRRPSSAARIHDGFTVRDPDGYVVSVSNSHVAGRFRRVLASVVARAPLRHAAFALGLFLGWRGSWGGTMGRLPVPSTRAQLWRVLRSWSAGQRWSSSS